MKNSFEETSRGSLDIEKEEIKYPEGRYARKFFFKCIQMGITGGTDGYVLLKSQELSMMGGWRLAWFGQDFEKYIPIPETIFFLFTKLPPPRSPGSALKSRVL